MNKLNKISELTISRLPKYLVHLKKIREKGQEYTSATAMGEFLGIHHTQIRKDLAATGIKGKAKVGHVVEDAINIIERFLGWDKSTDAFLVGAGNLGAALAGYSDFYECGLNIVALFDDFPGKIGSIVNGIPVFDIAELPYMAKTAQPEVGIITTPATSAQKVCDLLIESGVRAIWNFSSCMLRVPANIILENTSILASLAVLSRKIEGRK